MTNKLKLALVAAVSAVLFAGAGVGAGLAYADQTHMDNALGDLNAAQSELQAALPDKAGHRVDALGLVDQAINQVNLGIQAGSR
jgi:hypothetical protein